MTFIDGTVTHEILACEPPSDAEVRRVAVALIGVAVAPGDLTDDDRAVAHDVAEAIGLIPTTHAPDATFRDPVTGTKRRWAPACS